MKTRNSSPGDRGGQRNKTPLNAGLVRKSRKCPGEKQEKFVTMAKKLANRPKEKK
jgi:hypothetical protein